VAVGEHLGYLFTGLWTALAGVALIQSDLLHPLFGIVGLLLASLFMLGSLEFVGSFEARGWTLAGALVPLAYIGWSLAAGPPHRPAHHRLTGMGKSPGGDRSQGTPTRRPVPGESLIRRRPRRLQDPAGGPQARPASARWNLHGSAVT
jgi:hypothetical protein